MNEEELIHDSLLEALESLTEHERRPTYLELDRFIRSLGYIKLPVGESPVLTEEPKK